MQKKNINKVAMAIAIFLHVLLLFINFQRPLKKYASAYSIEVSTVGKSDLGKKFENLVEDDKTIVPSVVASEVPDSIALSSKSKQKTKKIDKIVNEVDVSNVEVIEKDVDSRSIYSTENHPQKETAVQLDMEGWHWDSVPRPNDTTDEVGKVVFEITIDETGFVVGVREKEKTISPTLSALYKDSIINLTFSKTSDDSSDQGVTKGTVTFILHSK
jgi:hypothetical protein